MGKCKTCGQETAEAVCEVAIDFETGAIHAPGRGSYEFMIFGQDGDGMYPLFDGDDGASISSDDVGIQAIREQLGCERRVWYCMFGRKGAERLRDFLTEQLVED